MSNYENLKKELIIEREELLKEFDSLYLKIMKYQSKLSKLEAAIENDKESLDNLLFQLGTEESQMTRLAIALMYVKDPTNQEIIEYLVENIEVNLDDENNNLSSQISKLK